MSTAHIRPALLSTACRMLTALLCACYLAFFIVMQVLASDSGIVLKRGAPPRTAVAAVSVFALNGLHNSSSFSRPQSVFSAFACRRAGAVFDAALMEEKVYDIAISARIVRGLRAEPPLRLAGANLTTFEARLVQSADRLLDLANGVVDSVDEFAVESVALTVCVRCL